MDLPVDKIISNTWINIIIDIDRSLETKIMAYKLGLETDANEKSSLKYIEK